MTSKDLVAAEDEGERSPARAVLTSRQNRFVDGMFETNGNRAAAARMAGYTGTAETLAKTANRLLRDPKVIAAIGETMKQLIRGDMAPWALRIVREIGDTAGHKDQLKAAMAVINRIDPEITKQEIDVTHTHMTKDERDLADLRGWRSVPNVTREFLISTFGELRLEELEALERAAAAKNAKVIEGKSEIVFADEELGL